MNTLWMYLFCGGGKKAGENLQQCVTEATVTMAKNMWSFGPTEHSCTFLRSRGIFNVWQGSSQSAPANKVESSLVLHLCVSTVFLDIPAHSSNRNVHSKPPGYDAARLSHSSIRRIPASWFQTGLSASVGQHQSISWQQPQQDLMLLYSFLLKSF